MFGKPEWFAPKKFGWGLRPVAKEGWVYTGIWAAVLVVPFLLLLLIGKWPEGLIWMAFAIGVLVVDVKLILKAMARQEEEKDVYRIMDEEETRQETTETGKFAMHVTESGRVKLSEPGQAKQA